VVKKFELEKFEGQHLQWRDSELVPKQQEGTARQVAVPTVPQQLRCKGRLRSTKPAIEVSVRVRSRSRACRGYWVADESAMKSTRAPKKAF